MNNDNMPQVMGPMSNFPELPKLFQNAMPIEIPRASFSDGHWSLFLGNIKRGQIEKATDREAKIAENQLRSVNAKQEALFLAITFGPKVENFFAETKHNTIIRELEVQERQADVYMKQAQAQQAGFEAKAAEADWEMREIQMKKMKKKMEEETVDV
jgi:hypothetical protein